MSEYYYLDAQHQQQGPVDASMLQSLGVTPETYVWTQGMKEWQVAGQVPELIALFQQTGQSTYYSGQPKAPFQQPFQGQQPHVRPLNQPIQPQQQPGNNGNINSKMPDNNLVWAIIAILMCTPIGIYAIVLSLKVSQLYNSGDYAGAQKAADDTKKWSIYSIIAAIVFLIISLAGGA